MQLANIQLALGGDTVNTVYKGGEEPTRFPVKGQTSRGSVTAAEIPVLQAIHGQDAVFDIEPAGEWPISNREERARLDALYSPGDGRPSPVSALYPGAAARVFERLDELGLPETAFKAERRMTTATAPAPTAAATAAAEPNMEKINGGDGDGKRRTRGRKPAGREDGRSAAGGDQGRGAVAERASGGQGTLGVGSNGHGSAGQLGSAGVGDAGVGHPGEAHAAGYETPLEAEVDGIRPMPDQRLFG